MKFFKVICICFVLIGCTSENEIYEDPKFISDRIENSMQSASGIDLSIDMQDSDPNSIMIEIIGTNPGATSVDILHSSSYPIILIYAKGEMIEPSPEILDELVIFDDLNITRIKAQESKRFQEVRFAKPPGDSIQLRAYMIYDMESQDSLYKDLHSITDEIVISR